MEENFDVKTMLNEACQELQLQEICIDSLRAHTRTIFNASSLILPLLGTLLIFSDIDDEIKGIYIAIIALMILLFISLLILSLIIMNPSSFYRPFQMDFEKLKDAFLGEEEREIIKLQVTSYLNAINLNQPTLNPKTKNRLQQLVLSLL